MVIPLRANQDLTPMLGYFIALKLSQATTFHVFEIYTACDLAYSEKSMSSNASNFKTRQLTISKFSVKTAIHIWITWNKLLASCSTAAIRV